MSEANPLNRNDAINPHSKRARRKNRALLVYFFAQLPPQETQELHSEQLEQPEQPPQCPPFFLSRIMAAITAATTRARTRRTKASPEWV